MADDATIDPIVDPKTGQPVPVKDPSIQNRDDAVRNFAEKTLGPIWDAGDAIGEMMRSGKVDPGEAATAAANVMLGVAAPPGGRAAEAVAPQFYSAAERAIANSSTKAAHPQQWLGMLKNAPGIKPEELEWTGLGDFLQGQQGIVPKQAILDHLANNKIDVQEVLKGDDLTPHQFGTPEEQVAARARLDRALAAIHASRPGTAGWEAAGEEHRAAEQAMRDIVPGWGRAEGSSTNPTKHGQWVLPGGKNYRELLLTMPPNGPTVDDLAKQTNWKIQQAAGLDGGYNVVNARGMAMGWGRTPNEAVAHALPGAKSENNFYATGHWDEPNVLAHVRFDDRTIDGDKTLHIAEIQSDWHQKGRDLGYKTGSEPQYIPMVAPSDVKIAGREHDWLGTTPDGRTQAVGKGTVGSEEEARDYISRYLNDKAYRANQQIDAATRKQVPDAPFKKTWHELALKRMIRYAAENGYDRISWDSGITNAERYDLSQHVDRLHWVRDPTGSAGELRAFKEGERVVTKRMDVSELPGTVGKEVADRLLSAKEQPGGIHGQRVRGIAGQDLKIGGEGMKGFYDQILPASANKLVKKYGAKVEDAGLDTRAPDKGWMDGTEAMRTMHGRPGWEDMPNPDHTEAANIWFARLMRKQRDKLFEDARAAKGEHLAAHVHTIRLTPELKKAALSQGFPMFSTGGRVSARAHGGRVEPRNVARGVSEAQAEAGNYRKDHIHMHGMQIAIENAKGHTRSGVGRDGKPWSVVMPAHYGYIKRTEGKDGDHVDAYIGPHKASPRVYVIDQVEAETKKFDEHKVFIGFGSEAQVINTYKKAFSDGKGADRIGRLVSMTVRQFRDWLEHGDTTKPFQHVASREERVREIVARHAS